MKIYILCVVLLAASCRETQSANAKLNEACHYDKDCITDLTYCKNQQTCQCMIGYLPLDTNDGCQATEGTECLSSYDCTDVGGLQNSECSQNICVCKQFYVIHSNKSMCLALPTTLLDPCVETLQCTHAFGASSFCNTLSRSCQCTSNYHFANKTCIQSVGLRGQCSQSYQCYVLDKNNQTVGECIDGTCRCRGGYVDAGDHCDNGASLFTTAFFTTLLLLVISRIIA